MIVRATKKIVDGRYEWDFGHSLTSYKKEQKQIEQDITSALLEFTDDCFWALNHGIDWTTRMGYKNQKELLDKDIYNVIVNRYGVLSVTNFESSVVERTYACQCEVYTIYSQDAMVYTFTNVLGG